jgi:hypothetical protein
VTESAPEIEGGSEDVPELLGGHKPSDAAAAIYGSILVTALVTALSHAEHDALTLALSVASTMVVFYLAHVWSALVGERIARPRDLSHGHLLELAREEWPMLESGAVSMVVLLLAEAGAYSTDTGVDLAMWLGVANLFGWGLVLGRRNYDTWPLALGAAVVNGLFGVGIVILEVLIH